jgi:hypothetical protein
MPRYADVRNGQQKEGVHQPLFNEVRIANDMGTAKTQKLYDLKS